LLRAGKLAWFWLPENLDELITECRKSKRCAAAARAYRRRWTRYRRTKRRSSLPRGSASAISLRSSSSLSVSFAVTLWRSRSATGFRGRPDPGLAPPLALFRRPIRHLVRSGTVCLRRPLLAASHDREGPAELGTPPGLGRVAAAGGSFLWDATRPCARNSPILPPESDAPSSGIRALRGGLRVADGQMLGKLRRS